MDFLIVSNNEQNINFAKTYNIWQTTNTFHQIKVGDFGFIKLSSTNDISFLGVVESIAQEPLLKWPNPSYDKKDSQTNFTIRFRQPTNNDFKKGQNAIRARKI